MRKNTSYDLNKLIIPDTINSVDHICKAKIALAKIESGVAKNSSVKVVVKIAKLLKVSLDDLAS